MSQDSVHSVELGDAQEVLIKMDRVDTTVVSANKRF